MVSEIMHISNMELLLKNNISMAIPPFQRKGEFGAGCRLRTTGRSHFNISGLVYLSCLMAINKRLINILSKKCVEPRKTNGICALPCLCKLLNVLK